MIDPAAAAALLPYVPRLVVDWLATEAGDEARSLDGTLVFADISGFTALTEKLSERGKAGAEEMGDVLNATFDHLLADAYAHGAGLLKWGGDAVLLAYTGDGHAHRACRASRLMQHTIDRVGRISTSTGAVELGMSIGVHTGLIDLVLADTPTRELLVVGPAATAVTTMEKYAERGQVLLSPSTATALEAAAGISCGRASGPGFLLEEDVPGDESPAPSSAVAAFTAGAAGVNLSQAVEPSLVAHLLDGPVAPEHRHIAVGFIQFSGVDDLLADEGMDAVVDALRHLLTRAQNAVATQQVTLLSTDVNADGGKLIIVSGAPRVTGDDEARVLAAVREVMADPGRLALRAGVNHGRVFAGDYGPSYRRVYSVAGDCVNLAARLMAASETGQVRTLRSVLDRSRTVYDAVELPPFEAKGKSEPVRSWAVGEPRLDSIDLSRQAGAPLLGRDRELEELLAALEAARTVGRAVRITGQRGMGKTRLVDEFIRRAPLAVLRMVGEPYAAATSYSPWRKVLRHALDLPVDAAPELVAERLGAAGEADPELAPWLPLVGIAAGVELPMTEAVAALDPKFRRIRLEEVVVGWLERRLPGPLVMVFEDPHLMDAASHDLLRRVADSAADRTWLLLLVHPDEQPLPFPLTPDAATLHLGPLTEEAAFDLLRRRCGERAMAPRRLEAIVRRAAGNPLYLTEILAAALAGEDVEQLPASVEQLAAARVDRLGAGDRQVVRAAAVLGIEVDPLLLADLLLAPPDLSRLRDFIETSADGRLAFVHPILREAAYEGLPFSRRRILHARAAAALTRRLGDAVEDAAALLSEHHLAAHEWDEAWMRSLQAGEQARRRYAVDDALTLFERARSAVAGGAQVERVERCRVEQAIGDLAYVLGDFDIAEQAFARARRLVDDPVVLADLRLATARVLERRGDHSRALSWLTRARQGLDGLDHTAARAARAALDARRAWIRYQQGRPAEALVAARAAEQEAIAAGANDTLALALLVHDYVDVDLGQLDGPPHGLRALELLDHATQRAEVGHTYGGLGVRAYYQGDWIDAAQHYRRAQEAYAAAGDRWQVALMQANLAELLIDQGQTDEAERLIQDALPVWRAAGQRAEVAFGEMLLGRAALGQERSEDAARHLAEAHRLFSEVGERGSIRLVAALTAEVRLRAKDPAGALGSVIDAMGEVPESDPWVPLLHRVRGEALALLGRVGDAREALLQSVESARSRGARHDVAFALDALDRHGLGISEEQRAERDDTCSALGIVRRTLSDERDLSLVD